MQSVHVTYANSLGVELPTAEVQRHVTGWGAPPQGQKARALATGFREKRGVQVLLGLLQ